ncbi:hypothetical protein [Demequina lutea]|uniref:Uncharacterized protein n=1 Tax=Demequina lutea TaxID=431489 RepID=A0A7Y9Z9E9_9MICO|nr:hypothetical protein [Demequina lutea]NYI39925.1 hypothetical protein [Demequina lutea]
MTGARVVNPRLVLRLPGTWVQLDPSRPELTDKRIRAFVRLSMGRADELATARADMRKALGLLVERADPAAALESTFLCHEVSPGVPAPIAVSVFTPEAIRMSPVIGTRPEDVIAGFMAAMKAIGDGGGWEVRPCADGASARRWHIAETVVAEGLEDVPIRAFSADYWRTVPGSKRLVLVTVTSPLADIPQTLLHLADAIVAGSRFAPA